MNGYGQSFARQLRTAKRRARLSGRAITAGEVSGMARGEAEAAGLRLARAKGLELQERGLTQQQAQFEASQAQRESQFGRTMEETRLSREQIATLQAERLASQKELQLAGQEWRTGERTAGQEWQAGEALLQRDWQAGESALDRAESQRQFDLLYGPPEVPEESDWRNDPEYLAYLKWKRKQPPIPEGTGR